MNPTKVDLTNCDREPIHQPGAIQQHGVLIVCDAETLAITHVSENAATILGIGPGELIGSDVLALFAADVREGIAQALRSEFHATPMYLYTVTVGSRSLDAITHRSGNHLIVEFEPAEQNRLHSAPELYRLVQHSIVQLFRSQSVAGLAELCAHQVRQLSKFDRVMVYQFDHEWNGSVIAEEKRDDLEPFLGLHYPASDIPAQARELYTRNWLRFIANRDYIPSRIVPEVGPDSAQPLDLSFSVLRSVSPIHLEYLRNMGVGASMSMSLIRDGRLWGLIACHHYSPRYVPYDVRTACELLGQIMSQTIAAAEDREMADYRASMRRVANEMSENLKHFDDTAKALIESTPTLLDFVDASGAAVVVGDSVTRIGQTPGIEDIRELARWMSENVSDDVFSTDNLHREFGGHRLTAVAAGVLAVSLTASRPHHLFWFRAEQIREVHWAGDPAKSIVKGEGSVRLSPRGSFALWKEIVRGRSKPWSRFELDAAQLLRDRISSQLLRRSERLAAANTDMRLASEEREKAFEAERAARTEVARVSRAKDDFVATLSHELRTPLNAILGWAQVLAHREDLNAEITEGLEVIERNARSQAKMIEDLLDVSRIISGKIRLDLQDTDLPAIVNSAIDTVTLAAAAKNIRIEKIIDPLHGVKTTGDPTRLQQIAWNLLSNAVKFTPAGGKVQVVLERVQSHVELSISDTGPGIAADFLPHVFERFRQANTSTTRRAGGLGLGLAIVRDLVELHGGNVRAFSAGAGRGSTFVVSLPIRAVEAPERDSDTPADSSAGWADCESLNLKGVQVLVLDDEADARTLVQRILHSCECEAVTFGTAGEALACGESTRFDVLISDIGMPDGDGFEFIRNWREQEAKGGRARTPAVALTAYARGDDRRKALLAGFQAHLTKPVDAKELLALVASLAGRV